jgi:hypothetical protein
MNPSKDCKAVKGCNTVKACLQKGKCLGKSMLKKEVAKPSPSGGR